MLNPVARHTAFKFTYAEEKLREFVEYDEIDLKLD